MLLMGGGMLGVTLSGNLFALLAGALLAGIGFGGVLAAGNGLIAQLFAARSTTALNGVNLFFGVGSMLGPAIAGLAGARLGVPQAALWAGTGLLIALAPAVPGRSGTWRPAHVAAQTLERGAARTASLWLFGLLLLCYTGTEVGFGGWVTVYLISSAKLEPATAALVASGFWLALTVGRALGAVLGLRLRPLALLAGSLLGAIGGAALLIAGVGDIERSIVGVLLLGLSCGPIFPTVLAVVTTTARGSGTATSLVLALGNGGGLIIPALLGLLLDRNGPRAMGELVLATALTMLALCMAAVGLALARRSSSLTPRPPLPAAGEGEEVVP
jgi:fucose permease